MDRIIGPSRVCQQVHRSGTFRRHGLSRDFWITFETGKILLKPKTAVDSSVAKDPTKNEITKLKKEILQLKKRNKELSR